MIEVTTNYGPNPAPLRYVYVGRQQPEEALETETSNAKSAGLPEPPEWSDFVLLLMRALMPFPSDARDAVLAAIEKSTRVHRHEPPAELRYRAEIYRYAAIPVTRSPITSAWIWSVPS